MYLRSYYVAILIYFRPILHTPSDHLRTDQTSLYRYMPVILHVLIAKRHTHGTKPSSVPIVCLWVKNAHFDVFFSLKKKLMNRTPYTAPQTEVRSF